MSVQLNNLGRNIGTYLVHEVKQLQAVREVRHGSDVYGGETREVLYIGFRHWILEQRSWGSLFFCDAGTSALNINEDGVAKY